MRLSRARSKKMRGGGTCSSYSMVPSDIPGRMVPQSLGKCNETGQFGGKRSNKKSVRNNRKNRKANSVKKSKGKLSQKKIDLVIDQLCKNMKRKCTPKYKQLLKQIVVKNL
jgi:hypothetical protein